MPKTEHTPGPIKAIMHDDGAGFGLAGPNGERIACHVDPFWEASPDPQRTKAVIAANARRLVACWNAHDALLEALHAVIPDLELHASTHGPGPDRRLADVRNAIELAEKGT